MSGVRRSLAACAVVVVVAVALDLATKALALELPPGGMSVLPVLNLRLSFNEGISFGLFHGSESEWVRLALLVVPIAAVAVMGWLAWHTSDSAERFGYAAISGGALGNLLDRWPGGKVTDFIDAHAAGWHFPTFNLADVAITLGAAALVIAMLRPRPEAGTPLRG